MKNLCAKVDQDLNRATVARENVSPEGGWELTDEELEQVTGAFWGKFDLPIPPPPPPPPYMPQPHRIAN